MQAEQLKPKEFDQFRTLIYEKCGIRIGDHKVALLSNRIRGRVKACGCADFGAYYRYLISPQASSEIGPFLEAVTTNETSFLRTPEHFDWFGRDFLGECTGAARRGLRPKRLRLWSAGCSSGEEAYSLALCLAENRLRLRGWDLRVMATDINSAVLEKARAGVYGPRSFAGRQPDEQRRGFTAGPDADTWQVGPELKRHVEFRRHNLLEPAIGGPFDCVFLRNVLIYFDEPSKRRALTSVVAALAPGGYLVLGPSEGAWGLLDGLDKRKPWLYQLPTGRGPS